MLRRDNIWWMVCPAVEAAAAAADDDDDDEIMLMYCETAINRYCIAQDCGKEVNTVLHIL